MPHQQIFETIFRNILPRKIPSKKSPLCALRALCESLPSPLPSLPILSPSLSILLNQIPAPVPAPRENPHARFNFSVRISAAAATHSGHGVRHSPLILKHSLPPVRATNSAATSAARSRPASSVAQKSAPHSPPGARPLPHAANFSSRSSRPKPCATACAQLRRNGGLRKLSSAFSFGVTAPRLRKRSRFSNPFFTRTGNPENPALRPRIKQLSPLKTPRRKKITVPSKTPRRKK